MSRLLAVLLLLPIVAGAQEPGDLATARPSFAEPGISPDGSTIAFVSGGDIWEVPARGGEARLLVSHPATESRPMYSPDGGRLAFSSTRTGNGDIYVLTIASGDLKRLTFDDANELMNGWSPDGKWIYFSSGSHDLGSMFDIFRVAPDGGTPMPAAADRYATEYFGAPGPGGVLAITARGFAGSQWWRKGHSHLDESEIWLVRGGGASPAYERVTKGGAKDAWPMWGADGKMLYFMSDRSGAQNIWTLPLGGAPKAVTTFRDGRVLWPTITTDARTIAFERDFGVWTADTATGQAHEVPIAPRGAPAGAAVDHRTFSDQIQELALSPDGRKIAFTVHGEVFSTSAKDGGDAVRLTTTSAEEFGLAWAPDSRRLVYVSDRDGTDHLFEYDFGTERETQLTRGDARDHAPLFSPDGKWIAFERGNRELRVLDTATRQDKLVTRAILNAPRNGQPREFQWSPDSLSLAVITTGVKAFQNVSIASFETPGDARAISFLADSNAGSVAWSPDGTYLTFVASQRTEPGKVVRVDLIPKTPRFREDQFRDLFKEETPKTPDAPRPAAPSETTKPPAAAASPESPKPSDAGAAPASGRAKPVDIVYDGIRLRASVLPVGVDVNQQIISPDGKWMLLRATAAEQENLYIYSLDELSKEPAVARQLTSTPGSKQNPYFTPDNKEVIYLDRGRVNDITIDKRETKAIATSAELDVDFAREKLEVFQQAWTFLRDQFFDEQMNGVDWKAVRSTYEPRIAATRTGDEMRRVISLMLGELNASHMGISAPTGSTQTTLGRLVVDFDAAEYENNGRLRIADVVPLGPAALAGLKAGDYVVGVDGRPIDRRVNLDELLDHTIDKRVTLGVTPAPSAAPHDVSVKPVNQTTEKGLRYRQWVEQRREYVAKASGGRLGYVHMIDMSAEALAQLHLDLDADNQAREGVVVDVRNNNGGFVNVYAIDVLTRRGYFNMARRGLPIPPVSSRTSLGQRALERPTILVTNQHSLSDAEDFTEGYRSLKLGKVVGEPTAGWIIYTGSVSLIDGSALRMPFTKIFANDGTPMEMHPRPVDVLVTRPVGESYSGKDSQLDAAVAELLKQISATKPSSADFRH